jgi:hypothetical protein
LAGGALAIVVALSLIALVAGWWSVVVIGALSVLWPGKQKAPAYPAGVLLVSVVTALAVSLPPRTSRLPPGAGNKGEEPKYEEVELGEEAIGGVDADGHAATVGANGDSGKAAVGPGLGHVLSVSCGLTP